MAVQTPPHTNSEQNVNSAAMDREPNQNPQDVGRGEDAALYKNAEGPQTGGNRAFHMNDRRDNQPKSIDEGSSVIASSNSRLPQNDQQGITNRPGSEERERQKKVIGGS